MVHLDSTKWSLSFLMNNTSHALLWNAWLETLKTLKMPTYRHYTGVPRRWSCCSRRWNPPTAADTRPGWRTSPPGRWCWALKTERNHNLVSRALSGGGGMFAPRWNEMSCQCIGNRLLQNGGNNSAKTRRRAFSRVFCVFCQIPTQICRL